MRLYQKPGVYSTLAEFLQGLLLTQHVVLITSATTAHSACLATLEGRGVELELDTERAAGGRSLFFFYNKIYY